MPWISTLSTTVAMKFVRISFNYVYLPKVIGASSVCMDSGIFGGLRRMITSYCESDEITNPLFTTPPFNYLRQLHSICLHQNLVPCPSAQFPIFSRQSILNTQSSSKMMSKFCSFATLVLTLSSLNAVNATPQIGSDIQFGKRDANVKFTTYRAGL